MCISTKIVISVAVLILFPSIVLGIDWQQLIREVEEQYNGHSSHSTMQMKVRTAHWQRRLTMEAWSLERDHFLVRIVAPAKEQGVATLKVDKEVWNYLPNVDRVIKVPPSLMGGAWMGSHITNNDLVKAAHIDEDYVFQLQEENAEIWRIEGIPKAAAAVVWGRIIYTVRKADRVPLLVEYFDEEYELVRTITFADIQTVGNRTIPLKMIVQPIDKPEEQTVLHYENIAFDLPLTASFFSLRELKKR
ncbi:MAG: outer membrane lipoprotein-sorting protein [Desulfuromonadales bacterium]|nr:outer membrane lipoprotein-sorting protein [Desulfuromonadales bacterium]